MTSEPGRRSSRSGKLREFTLPRPRGESLTATRRP